ncbi:hypothetical protein JCM19233_6350 [Vibrio astriarenae]|nr:hypothetical protein JCM19233_6350 [Vibrio sp. C7]
MQERFSHKDITLQKLWSWLALAFGLIISLMGNAWGGLVVVLSLIWKMGLVVAQKLLD